MDFNRRYSKTQVTHRRARQPDASVVESAALPWDALLICLAALLLIDTGRLHSVIPGIEILRPALLLGGLSLVLYIGDTSPARSLRHLKHPLGWMALFFAGWAVLGAPLGVYPGYSVRFVTNGLVRFVIIFILLAACVRNLQDVRRLIMTLAVGGMVFALFAALPMGFQMVGGGGYDPNDSAMFMVITLSPVLYFLTRERRPLYKLLFAAALVVIMIGIIRTGSRGGFLALVAVVGYTLFFFREIRLVFRLATVGMIALAVTFAATAEFWERIETINDPTDYNYTDPAGRKAIWARARGYMIENPVLGVGITAFPFAEANHPMIVESISRGVGFKYSAAHSIWYQVGAEMGFPGLLAFLAMFGLSILYLLRLQKYARAAPGAEHLQEAAGLGSVLIGCLIAIMVAGTFLSNAYTMMVWGIFALVLGLLKVMRFQGIDVTRRPSLAGVQTAPGVRRRSALPARARLQPSMRTR